MSKTSGGNYGGGGRCGRTLLRGSTGVDILVMMVVLVL